MRLTNAKKKETLANVNNWIFEYVTQQKKYHRVVSINRPSGYEPDALPLRHDDDTSANFNVYNNICNICNIHNNQSINQYIFSKKNTSLGKFRSYLHRVRIRPYALHALQ